MIDVQRSEDRGKADYQWLKTRYSFSFADYYHPKRMGFGPLKVLNDDVVAPAAGFPMHSHDNMEIVTLVLKGSLKHEDSMGNKGVINAGEVQRMSAGTGVFHSEMNHSASGPVALLQIWVEPSSLNMKPSYEQKKLDLRKNEFVEVVGPGKKSVKIHQECRFLLGRFVRGEKATLKLGKAKGLFVFLIEGKVKVEDTILNRRDSAEITSEKDALFSILEESFVLAIEVVLG